MLLDVMNVSQLDDLGDTRRRFETNKLRLVLSKIPRLSGVEYLFKEFYTAAPAPSTRQICTRDASAARSAVGTSPTPDRVTSVYWRPR